MRHDEFQIGTVFWFCERQWRCTDVGTRTIVAIRIDSVFVTELKGGQEHHYTVSGTDAEAEGWFNGPPYAVNESVFNEYDLDACSLEP